MASSTTIPVGRRLRLHAPAALTGALGDGPIVARRGGGAALSSAPGLRRRPWLRRLRRALAEDLFVLHFQPILALADGRVSHHEVLLRLADAQELVAPGSFLPAAERYGLIAEIDRMVLARAIALLGGPLAKAGRQAPPALAVNVSALSVAEEDLLRLIDRCLAEHEVDPRRLIVEITETAAIPDMEGARRFCAGVKSLGCGVALDDFGAGFGSFRYLKHLPFDLLKIDGEFIRCLPASRTDQLVVRALVGVVRGMGRRTVAEFVEDAPTLSMLADYGVDFAQGFAVGTPQAALPAAL